MEDTSYSAVTVPDKEAQPVRIRVCLIGGRLITRRGIELLLKGQGIDVTAMFGPEDKLAEVLASEETLDFDVFVLIPSGAGPFRTFHELRELLGKTEHMLPVVVLSDRASRGEIYTALRTGAKAYVNLDSEPAELKKAIETAFRRKVYLAPDVAEQVVSEISGSTQQARKRQTSTAELSRRELEIVQLLCEGLSSKGIAQRLHISAKTVENHRYNIYRKCEVEGIAGLIRHAIQTGMVSI